MNAIEIQDSLMHIIQGITGLVYIINSISYLAEEGSHCTKKEDAEAMKLISQRFSEYRDELKQIHAALTEQHEKETKEMRDHLAKEQEQQCTRVPV